MSQNFILNEKRELQDIKSTGYLYSHKSGAEIFHIENEDDNKAFNTVFRTPPPDRTGIAHILEHCITEGSDRYHQNNSFNAIRKRSLATFINAMTWSDKTMYLVASCNEDVFLYLMRMSIDAVYSPLMYEYENTFLQEGWHYDLKRMDGELRINGVVYNEMKRTYSDPNSVLRFKTSEILFPESAYQYPSGGDPDYIPDLTYEQLKYYHKSFYHPSNNFLYFYGNMDIKKCFEVLDSSYLSKFERRARPDNGSASFQMQKPHNKPLFGEGYYSISEGRERRNYLGAAFALNESNPELLLSISILTLILFDTSVSPLKCALLNIGESVSVYFDKYQCQPVLNISVKNSRFDAMELQKVIFDVLTLIIKKGLDCKFIESCMNIFEFSLREADYGNISEGIALHLAYMHGWFYGQNPFKCLDNLGYITNIRKKIANGERYFEGLILKHIINNSFSCYVTLKPKAGLQSQKDALLKERLRSYKATLSQADLIRIVEKNKGSQSDTETTMFINSVPNISISSIEKKAYVTPIEKRNANGIKCLYVPIDTRGIVYNTFSFNTSSLCKDEIAVMGTLLHLLGKLDTKKRLFPDLINDKYANLGDIRFMFKLYRHIDGVSFIPAVEVAVRALEGKISKIYSITFEILTETLFDNKARIKTLLTELLVDLECSLLNFKNNYSSWRTFAYMGNKGAYRELTEGFSFYKYIQSLMVDFDQNFNKLRSNLLRVSQKIFTKSAGSVSVACSESIFTGISKLAGDFFNRLPQGGDIIIENLVPLSKNEGIIMESNVQYNVIAGDFLMMGFRFTGALYILMNVLSQEYLYPELRINGGAYACSAHITNDGYMYCSSFRDPQLKHTYKIFMSMADFVESFNPNDVEMLRYVLGVINEFDQPKTPRIKFEKAVAGKLMGITPYLRQKERDEVLFVNAKKIRELSPLVSSCVAQKNICTFGERECIENNKHLFEAIIRMN